MQRDEAENLMGGCGDGVHPQSALGQFGGLVELALVKELFGLLDAGLPIGHLHIRQERFLCWTQ
jgi:hypothetical protein